MSLPGVRGQRPRRKNVMTDITCLLRCPLCGGAFSKKDNSLVCGKRHCYDIARQGYVNFVPGQKDMFYKKELFEARAAVFAAGIYAPVVARLSDVLSRYAPGENPVIVDAGCGEGYYTKAVCPERAMTRIGFDLSKDAVKLAARGKKTAAFFAADLKRIPLADGCADAVLDIFTPADYSEFKRILKPDGVLIKLAPRSGYLRSCGKRRAICCAGRNTTTATWRAMRRRRWRFSIARRSPIRWTLRLRRRRIWRG